MFKYRPKRPFLCLFWALPLLAAIGIDLWIWQFDNGSGFHFSDSGYLIQHYMPEAHDRIAYAVDSPLYQAFLGTLFRTKSAVLGLAIAAIAFLIINRPRRG